MTDALKEKFSKIYALAQSGGTDGEKAAAKAALDRMIEKYNIDESQLGLLDYKNYFFSYKTYLDESLFCRLMYFFLPNYKHSIFKTNFNNGQRVKQLYVFLTYSEWITIECTYEYFKRHMAAQWKSVCAVEIAKKRKAKTKTARLKELQPLFISRYMIESKLVRQEDIKLLDWDDMTPKEKADREKMMDISGGNYNKQVVGGLFLGN